MSIEKRRSREPGAFSLRVEDLGFALPLPLALPLSLSLEAGTLSDGA